METLPQHLLDEATLWAPRLAGVIVIFAIFFVLSRLLRRVIRGAAEQLKIDDNLASLLARTSSITLMIFGMVTALGTLGINVSAIVAGLGLTGFALGFALKDSISNLLSGVLILLYQPFKVGDCIQIAGFEGTVISIDLRYTELASNNDKILIPNSKLFTDPIRVLGQQQPSATTAEKKP